MEYIKIKKDTNIYLNKTKKFYNFIQNELITLKEFEKIQNKTTNIFKKLEFELIKTNKQNTFFVFGARFEKSGI